MSNKALIRLDPVHKLDNLPGIVKISFKDHEKDVFSGSIIKRPLKNSAKTFWHYGIFYGIDINGNFWMIENNDDGVECVSRRDFMRNESIFEVTHIISDSTKFNEILERARSVSDKDYFFRDNNCEHFVNYCVFGESESRQVELVEEGVGAALATLELFYTLKGDDTVFRGMIYSFDSLRISLNLPRNVNLDKIIKLRRKGTPIDKIYNSHAYKRFMKVLHDNKTHE